MSMHAFMLACMCMAPGTMEFSLNGATILPQRHLNLGSFFFLMAILGPHGSSDAEKIQPMAQVTKG